MSDARVEVKIWKWLSGFGLATTLLVLLGVLTWLATLEMVDIGLLRTLRKYFHWTAFYVVPEINGKRLLPLPGGYWVCALLLVNMTLGGLIRARKGWKTAGVLMAHFGIIFMVAAGGVAQLFERRGVMMLVEGEQADFAVSLNEPTLEVLPIEDGEVAGEITVATAEDLAGLEPDDHRIVRLPGLPFDLEVTGWQPNAIVRPASPAESGIAVDGWAIRPQERNKEGEMDAAACYARVLREDGSKGAPFILAVPPPQTGRDRYPPQVVDTADGRFAVRMVKATISVPYSVKLKDAVAEYYPNSARPKEFLSDIERRGADGETVGVRISMNQPMRRDGFTFFQRTMSSGPQRGPGPEFSGFEVVSNPADKWPEYSLYLVTAGLLLQFLMKFGLFLRGATRPQTPPTA